MTFRSIISLLSLLFFVIYSVLNFYIQPALAATTHRIVIYGYAESDSESIPQAEREGDVFVQVNDTGVKFYNVPNSLTIYSDESKTGEIEGSFSSTLLKPGSNRFFFAYQAARGPDIYVNEEQTVILNPDYNKRGRQLFKVKRVGKGDAQVFQGSTTVNLSLKEIDLDLFNEIERLRNEASRLAKGIEEKRKFNQDNKDIIDRIRREIEEIADKSFDDLTESEFLDLARDQPDIIDLLKSFKETTSSLQAQIKKEIEDLKRTLEDARKTAQDELNSEGINITDLNFYIFNEPIAPPSIDIPPIVDISDPFDPANDTYGRFADEVIQKLDTAWRSSDRVEFLNIVSAWINQNEQFLKLLELRSLVSKDEWNAYRNSVRKIERFLYGDSSREGFLARDRWFKDNPVPPDIRTTVLNQIASQEPNKAQKLRSSLNTWKGSSLTPEQERTLATIRAIGAGFVAIAEDVAGTTDRFRARWKRITDEAFIAVKEGLKCTGTTVALGDFGDLYELVAGTDVCSGEKLTLGGRIVTSVSIIGGSGKFWRIVGNKVFGIKPVAESAAVVIDKLSQGEKALKATVDALEAAYKGPVGGWKVVEDFVERDIRRGLTKADETYKDIFFQYLDESFDASGKFKFDFSRAGILPTEVKEWTYVIEPKTHKVRIAPRGVALQSHAQLAGSLSTTKAAEVRVYGAGLLRFDASMKLNSISNESGHFQPDASVQEYVKAVFTAHGLEKNIPFKKMLKDGTIKYE